MIGMLSAIELYRRGFSNVKILSKDEGVEDTTSYRAGALIFICFNEISTKEEARQRFAADFRESCIAYKRIVEGEDDLIPT